MQVNIPRAAAGGSAAQALPGAGAGGGRVLPRAWLGQVTPHHHLQVSIPRPASQTRRPPDTCNWAVRDL